MLNEIPAIIASDPQILHAFTHRFLSKLKVIPETGCWEFQGTRTRMGYGRFTFKYGNYSAHRLSHIIHTGPIPEGLIILHSCDNPPCCNPAHLRSGTHKENSQEAMDRGLFDPTAKYIGGLRVSVRPEASYVITEQDMEEVKMNIMLRSAMP